SLIGGELVQFLPPASALHGAALIAALAPVAVLFGTWYLVSEEKRPVNLPELRIAFAGLLAAFKTRGLWVVGLFLFLYYFSPRFNTPLYYHMTDNLHFSHGYIGSLGSIASACSFICALAYRWFLAEMA